MMPQPGMSPQQTQQWATSTQSQLRRRGMDPGRVGFGGQRPQTGGGFQIPSDLYSPGQGEMPRTRGPEQLAWQQQNPSRPQPKSSGNFSAYRPGQAMSQESPWSSSTPYQPSPPAQTPGFGARPAAAQAAQGMADIPVMQAPNFPVARPGPGGMPMGWRGPHPSSPAAQPDNFLRPLPFQSTMTGPFGQPADPNTYYQQQQSMIGNIFNQLGNAPQGTWLGGGQAPNWFTQPPTFNPAQMWQNASRQRIG